MVEEPTAFRPPEETPTVVTGERAAIQFTPGTILGDRYRIVSLVGRGGMGDVYRADDLKLGQSVALKFLARHGHAQRLYEEVRIGRQVSHPNVCRLYDIAEIDGRLFITMEFVDGEDLSSLLRRVGRLPTEKALAVSRDICAGLAAAHDKGVIHRDLKPANVMIDGRGRARVTDFGLALSGESRGDTAGTPAYMAPEQLSGEGASFKSDIYALGLVLYELFTGRRTFEATSTLDLLARQQRGDFTRPSLVTRDVPPLVERLIVRCLDPNPQARPNSVEEIALELPGGDPLAAAIAAGETPSPAMVAAAAKSGDLPAGFAWTLLGIAIAGFLATAVLSERTLLYRVSEVKAPEVLQERARQILADAGLMDRPRDSDLFLAKELAVNRIVAVYRQSRSAMRPFNGFGRLTTRDPPLEQGMANVTLDARGRLLRFAIAPPKIDKATPGVEPKWEPFVSAAGFDLLSLRRTVPEWSAPVDSDGKAAWLTQDGQRVEAAAYHGRPVWFAVISPQTARVATTPPDRPLAERLAIAMLIFFMIAIPIATLLLARSNLRRRQGDRAGALRVAMFSWIVAFFALAFTAHHPMNFIDEWGITSWHVAQATFWALITAIMYIALEPFVRKRWPQILISWTRLLAGRFTDPMVGRDLLIGAAAATLAMLVWQATLAGSGTATLGPVPALGPARFVVSQLFGCLGEAVFRGVGLVAFLLMLRAVIRYDIAASLLTALFIGISTLGHATGPFWLRAAFAFTAALLAVAAARYWGVLAAMSFAFFVLVQMRLPLTLDAGAWYFGRSALVLLLLVAITLYAFRISLGTRRWLPRLAFD